MKINFLGTLTLAGTPIVLLGAMSPYEARAQGFVSPCGVAQGDTAKWVNKVANGHG